MWQSVLLSYSDNDLERAGLPARSFVCNLDIIFEKMSAFPLFTALLVCYDNRR